MHHSRAIRPFAALPALALSLFVGAAGAGPVIQINPGQWASDSEVWINGQSLRAVQKASKAGEQKSCVTPQQSKIDLTSYLEQSMRDTGPWKCEVKADKLDSSAAAGTYACRTDGGGLTQGKFAATYSATSYRIELNGRGNAVDGRSGQAMGGTEMDQRMLSNGRWVGATCS